ncbi:hypothetical protein [Sphaerisporangium sp. NPDC051011]|uniref:hypothetical protein n=1 Tax=Sphaerisporangium sp. NPDC051011 TaxID=3155792 RepID=UPI0033D4A139
MTSTEVPILHARTLAEAYLYISLVIAADDLNPTNNTEPPTHEPAPTTDEPNKHLVRGESDEVREPDRCRDAEQVEEVEEGAKGVQKVAEAGEGVQEVDTFRGAGDAGEGIQELGAFGDAHPRARSRVIDYERCTTLTEGRTAWTLLFDGPGTGPRHRIIIVIPYETEFAARHGEARFGPGRSEIIDPGQWQLAGAGYAHRALHEATLYAQNPTDRARYQEVLANWSYAVDAVAEAAKFLPDDADAIPEDAFWTEEGATTRHDEPERFTREGLQSDLTLYQHHLTHFQNLHPPPR